jgi:hypothetical protein
MLQHSSMANFNSRLRFRFPSKGYADCGHYDSIIRESPTINMYPYLLKQRRTTI